MSEMTEQRGVLTETDAEPVTAATALDQVRAYLIRLKQIAAEENLATEPGSAASRAAFHRKMAFMDAIRVVDEIAARARRG